jgi:beta-galactosidase GanA
LNNKIILPIVLLLLAWWVSSANFVAKVEDPSQVRVLDDFESAGSAALWQGTYELSRQVATQGRQSLKVTLLPGIEKGLSSVKLPKDWSGYDWLGMEIVSKEKDPQILSLRIYDEMADDEQANVWSEAFLATRKVFLNPGTNHIRVLVKGMRTSSDTRAMAIDKVRRVILSNDQSGESLTIFVDNLRLVKGDPQQDRSSVSKPEDTVVTIRNRFVEIGQVGPRESIPEAAIVQEKRRKAQEELKSLQDAIQSARTQGLETIYAEIPLVVAELGLGIRPLLPWFNNDESKKELYQYVAQSCKEARFGLEDQITGRNRLPDTDDTQIPEPLVPELPTLKGLQMKDGFFVNSKGDPLNILSVHSPGLKLTRFFATPYQHIESYTAGGGSRWTVDDSPVYEVFHQFADAKRVGWDGWCGHLIRDRYSMGGKKEEVVICLESAQIRKAIEQFIRREAPKWMKNPDLLYNILAYELQYICYCEPSQRMFREWLQRKHKSIDTLNAHWKTSYESFQKIPAPPVKSSVPPPGTNRAQWYDWAVFNQERFTNHLAWVRDLVKQVDSSTPVTTGGSHSMLAGSNGTSGIDEELIINRVGDVILHEGGGSTLGMDLQLALSREKKPLCDPELSIEVKDLWPHLLHGKSVLQLWHWPAQPPSEYPTLIASSYAHSWSIPLADVEELLRTALDVRRLSKEIAAFGSVQPEAAILYSKTSIVQIPVQWMRSNSTPYLTELKNVYEASLYLDAKTTLISESQIRDGWARRYKVILVPSARHVQADVVERLLEFVAEGGTLILSPESFVANEYLEPLDFERKLGIKVQESTGAGEEKQGELAQEYDQTFRRERQIEKSPELKIKTLPRDVFANDPPTLQGRGVVQTLSLGTGNVILGEFLDGRPAIIRHPHGGGSVYRLATPLLPDQYAEMLDRIYAKAQIHRPIRAQSLAGQRVWGIEVRGVQRKSDQLVYIVNHTGSEHSIRIRSAGTPETGSELRSGRSVSLKKIDVRPFETQIIRLEPVR